MCETKNCYQECINKSFLIPENFWQNIELLLEKILPKIAIGRPPLDSKRGLNGIFYLLKTGIHWNAIPRCFGSSSAIHRLFQKLVLLGFFKKLWTYEVKRYDMIHGLNLEKQAIDCSHRKSPLGDESVGKSPVDRRKNGTKLSVLSEQNGIVLGIALGASNQHDSQLFFDTIKSIPPEI